jgi:MFS family permease
MADTVVTATSPLREVLAIVAFRRFLAAQFLSALANGTLRFVLVWLTLDLSDWDPAVGLVGLGLGIAGLAVAVPAGAINDRVDRRTLFVRLSAAAAAVLASITALVALDVATVPVVALHAVLLGGLLAAAAPGAQAMVPALVPADRLMNGVALQMISMNVAMMMGAIVGGAAIALAGNAGGLGLLAVVEVAAAALMARVDVPPNAVVKASTRLSADIVDGMRWALRREPTRSLLAIMALIGFMWGAVQLLLPEYAKEDLGAGVFATSALFAPLGVGMVLTSLRLANRTTIERRGRMLAIAFSVNAGPLVVVLGFVRSYWLALALMALWGVGGGIVMTMQRTLLQEDIPDHLMGRIMGLNTLAMLGSFPLAAAATAALTGAVSTAGALVALGAFTAVAATAVTGRRVIRTA